MLYQSLWVDVWLHYRWCSPLWGWMGSGCVGEWWWAETKCCLADWVRDTHTCKIEVTSNYTLNRLRKTLAKLMHVNVVLLPLYTRLVLSVHAWRYSTTYIVKVQRTCTRIVLCYTCSNRFAYTSFSACLYRNVQPRSLIDPYKYDKNSWTSCFSDR